MLDPTRCAGNSFIPQSGHRAGSVLVTSGCIGQAYPAVGAAVGSSFIPQSGHRAGSVLVTSGCIGHT